MPGDWIISSRMKRMTFQYTSDGQEYTTYKTVFLKRLQSICRAGGLESTDAKTFALAEFLIDADGAQ